MTKYPKIIFSTENKIYGNMFVRNLQVGTENRKDFTRTQVSTLFSIRLQNLKLHKCKIKLNLLFRELILQQGIFLMN